MTKTKAWVALALFIGLIVGAHLCANIPAVAQLARYSTTPKIRCDTLRVAHHMFVASTDSVGALLCAGNADIGGTMGVTGEATFSALATFEKPIVLTRLTGALDDTATVEAYGDGAVFLSISGGTLLIWDDTAKEFDCVALAITKDAS